MSMILTNVALFIELWIVIIIFLVIPSVTGFHDNSHNFSAIYG